MFFKVSAHAHGTARPGAAPPGFASVSGRADGTSASDHTQAIPKGFFTTRTVSASDLRQARQRVLGILSEEIEAFAVWSDYEIAIERVERVSFVEYALKSRKGGASWYLE